MYFAQIYLCCAVPVSEATLLPESVSQSEGEWREPLGIQLHSINVRSPTTARQKQTLVKY